MENAIAERFACTTNPKTAEDEGRRRGRLVDDTDLNRLRRGLGRGRAAALISRFWWGGLMRRSGDVFVAA
jgi:hypothetical protein